MEASTEYRRFAQECRRPAREAKTERHRNIMEDMARAWEGSRERPSRKALTLRPDRILPLRFGTPPGLPGEATPAPFATRWPELSGQGRRSPFPCTRRRSVDTRRIAPSGPLRCSIATRERA